ncbi:hypothetical protein G7K_4877-t1 [Saitoella complicata NRRL Y-17804]|uniref:Uncharacterized protein n=1 Tax=Saitoella complicata (strain BCRC 22490 / CBS 7301 / JCM 7358 / NBRC 10748 / NRRL Y-17804) TaxID=698492 RepID=A0A0E9NM29_SAICN|nr:hypothetical protein G7K_4877-t1 [Saitoella complicata NRRL Y-17804]
MSGGLGTDFVPFLMLHLVSTSLAAPGAKEADVERILEWVLKDFPELNTIARSSHLEKPQHLDQRPAPAMALLEWNWNGIGME